MVELPKKEASKEENYTLLSIFGLDVKTKNKRMAEVLTRRIVDAYEICVLIAILSFIAAIILDLADASFVGFTSSSFQKLTVISLLFAITFGLSLYIGQRQ